MSRYRFIAAERGHCSVRRLCQVVGVPASSFYAWQAFRRALALTYDDLIRNLLESFVAESTPNTKWKLPSTYRPTAADMQQVFAYCHLWQAGHGVLLYPRTS